MMNCYVQISNKDHLSIYYKKPMLVNFLKYLIWKTY